MKILPFLLALALTVDMSMSARADETPSMTADEERARTLGRALRCVVCQNQSVDESEAPLAQDIRRLVRERIAAGDSDEAVLDYIVARYGKFVLMKPPLSGDTVILYFGPLALFALAVGMAFFSLRRQPEAAPVAALTEDEEARVRNRLAPPAP